MIEIKNKIVFIIATLMLFGTFVPQTNGEDPLNLPPVADAGGPYFVNEGDMVIFNASGSYDPEGAELWYNWDFDGDGYPDLREWLDSSTITGIWFDDYYTTVTVFVTDWVDYVEDTTTVSVYNVAPTIELSAEPQTEPISFYDLATDPGSDDIKFTWDFGDGSTSVTTMYYNDGIAPDPYPSADEYNPMEITDTQIHTYMYPGLFTVTVTVEDDDNGVTIEMMTIQILGQMCPIADAGPDQTVEQTSYAGADVNLDGSGSYDPDNDPLTYDWTWTGGSAMGVSPTVTFPLGIATVTLTVSDGTYTDSDTVNITIVDTTPPEITQIGEPIDLWPPNHKYHIIKISDCVTSVTDNGDPDVDIDDIIITSVSSDEPEDVKGNGDGQTFDDIAIVDAQTMKLRSERQGAGNGRVYTINFEVTDLSGNIANGSCKVWVRHDQSGDPAIDDGAGAGYTVYYP
jgi:hypothetical protein